MGGWSKAIGAGLGFFIGGPIGGIVGYFLAGALNTTGKRTTSVFSQPQYKQHILYTNILAFMAALIKVDKKVTRTEKNEVVNILKTMFSLDNNDLDMSVRMFDEFLNSTLNISELSESYKKVSDKKMRIVLLEILFRLAMADGVFHPAEEKMIITVASILDISEYELNSIKATYIGSSDREGSEGMSSRKVFNKNRYYDLLEVPYNASEEEIKKSYRKLMVKYHPDKFGDIHPTAKELINNKVAKINEAYEKLTSS